MSVSPSLGYTASLCRMESTELVPYEQVDLTAATDIEAIQKAIDWVRTMREKIDGDSRLIVRLGARAIYSEALMTP
jgi:hypothetical protein